MKAMEKTISNLHVELLQYILTLVAQSSDGAADVARAKSVCKALMNASEDPDVLKAIGFNNVRISGQYKLFQHSNGLLKLCAQAGNVAAQYLLAKMVLVTSSQLLTRQLEKERLESSSGEPCSGEVPMEYTLAALFMIHFMPGEASTSAASHPSLSHYDLVRLFLCRCSPYDLVEMRPHLNHYISYFIGPDDDDCLVLYESIRKLHCLSSCVIAMEEIIERISGFFPVGALMDFAIKSKEAGLTVEEVVGGAVGWESLEDYYRNITTLFEEHRTNTILAFGRIFFP
ncbi:uncharacterized protein LOC132285329 [Cornus florida]|uniref:uncharacterized protein LOC132285329 n=1 Tax=Cornus florida TaxID=4283 RepID=UPI002898D628|nr:uncharacterized protein LOC132285329 [Cornus florida]XP_059643484.1 uncharacterized protein LOC132285329 [Cornus florida]XP_059643485.1 uncharacterized protein LOC132285329 [Cornus florida]XP_059643486.1 uncharacterized protein LOC132285329 [Cornus florida]XP_059643488.1 uncharacterized protein LOC132285329 [Cornus florida]XP_059643489.1 uncharacterized protein LOC132285329 [Cornus florida]